MAVRGSDRAVDDNCGGFAIKSRFKEGEEDGRLNQQSGGD
jgi:hypothetical protein